MGELKEQGRYVFGLDIGTRSIVGTVGYKDGDNFIVAAQEVREHETRAMLDGQIHDIGRVGNTIAQVKKALEKRLDVRLTDVCIAAAGRVLRTVETNAVLEFEKDTVITPEEIAGLTSKAIEQAYAKFQEVNDTDMKFYCVGNSVIRYYMNGYQISNPENHKAKSIGQDLIATFLPDDVVDGLYRAVELAGLKVVNVTLEPIAAIEVAIPERYRMLNIALVDVGAGTSDICITKDGCIVAYGMIPVAGDSLTEIVARECLVDFATAEKIKRQIMDNDVVEYEDIMGLPQQITKESVLNMLNDSLEQMTKLVSDKIIELNGEKTVSAVFVVGGGGKLEGYCKKLSEHLGIIAERVALRGEEVMQKIIFQEEVKKDSLLVTPVGICLNYYEQSNSFIYVTFNEERIKLYDNNNLAVVDAAMQAEFPNDGLFPKRGKEINYTVNGIKKICRGKLGEAAVIRVNGEVVDLYHAIRSNDVIEVEESTAGEAASLSLAKIPEFKSSIHITVNGSKIILPKYAGVNGELKTQYYEVADGDAIEILDYYTVAQVKEFMDVVLEDNMTVVVNNEVADDATKVYENFSIRWVLKDEAAVLVKPTRKQDVSLDTEEEASDEITYDELPEDDGEDTEIEKTSESEDKADVVLQEQESGEEETETQKPIISIGVIVNARPVTLKGKSSYVFVDVFDYIDFDHTSVQGKRLVTTVDGREAAYMEELREGAVIEIYWEK